MADHHGAHPSDSLRDALALFHSTNKITSVKMATPQRGSSAAEEEDAIIRKRFRTQTVVTTTTEMPMFKKLVKK